MNQCIRLSQSIDSLSEKSSVEHLKQAVVGLASVVGNLNSVNIIINVIMLT